MCGLEALLAAELSRAMHNILVSALLCHELSCYWCCMLAVCCLSFSNKYLQGDDMVRQKYSSTRLPSRLQVGAQYEPLFPYFASHHDGFRVVSDGYVTDDSGTGVVHQAPAFGEDDYR